MLGVVYVIVTIFVIGIGYLYISSVNKVNKADMAAKDAGSDIDTCLWDMNHNLGIVQGALTEKGVSLELPEDQSGALSVGMTSMIQQMVVKNVEERMKIVRKAAEENGITEEEAVKTALTKYDNARNELVGAGMKYNKMVARYNNTITKFPASIVASRKSKGAKMIFIYQPNQENKDA